MKSIVFALAAAISLAAFSSCGGKNGRPERESSGNSYLDSIHRADSLKEWGPPTAIDWKMALDKAYDDKRVTIEGYVALSSSSYSSSGSGQITIYERQNQYAGGQHFIVRVNTGRGKKNTMEKLKDGYTQDDLKITGKNGESIVYHDHVRITGVLSVQDSYTSIDVQEIEKIDPVAVDYSTLDPVTLTDENAKDESLEGKIMVAEGMLEIPSILTLGGTDIWMWLEVPGMEEKAVIDVAYGSGPARIEELPTTYSESDFKIHANDGSVINIKKKVRVYGVNQSGRFKLESIENI